MTISASKHRWSDDAFVDLISILISVFCYCRYLWLFDLQRMKICALISIVKLIYRITVRESFGFFILLHTWHQQKALAGQEDEGKDLKRNHHMWLDQVAMIKYFKGFPERDTVKEPSFRLTKHQRPINDRQFMRHLWWLLLKCRIKSKDVLFFWIFEPPCLRILILFSRGSLFLRFNPPKLICHSSHRPWLVIASLIFIHRGTSFSRCFTLV